MAMEITNNNSVYESTYTAQKQQTSKQQAAAKSETKETAAAQKNTGAKTGSNDYFNKLEKLVPSVECRIGTTFSSAKSGKTLTLNPKLLEKMQNDPEFEKEMMELIKGVETMTRLSESINKATGWTTVFRHSYIDENGKYCHIALIKNEFMYNMSDKLREERRQNSEKFIEKSKEKAAKKKEELQKALEEKRAEKIAASKDGMIYVDDAEFREIIEAMKEDSTDTKKANTKGQPTVGANLDLQV